MTDTPAAVGGLIQARELLARMLEIQITGPESAQSVAARAGAIIAVAQVELATAAQLDALTHLLEVDEKDYEILVLQEREIVVDTIRALAGFPPAAEAGA